MLMNKIGNTNAQNQELWKDTMMESSDINIIIKEYTA